MGTHPIFESDFDCLTDRSSYRLWPNSFHLSSRIIQLAGDHVNFQKNSRTCHINPFQSQTVWERFLIGPAQHIRTENMSISTNPNLLRRQTINTRISTTKMSHHSNWSTILRPNLEIDFSHDLEDREVDSLLKDVVNTINVTTLDMIQELKGNKTHNVENLERMHGITDDMETEEDTIDMAMTIAERMLPSRLKKTGKSFVKLNSTNWLLFVLLIFQKLKICMNADLLKPMIWVTIE